MNSDFSPDWMKGYQGYVADLLDGAVPVLIYAGDVDFVCNWIGNKAWTLELEWSGKEGFVAAEDAEILPHGQSESVGQVRSYGNLAFLRVYGAGHLAPMDKPAVLSDMVKVFTGTMPAPPTLVAAKAASF